MNFNSLFHLFFPFITNNNLSKCVKVNPDGVKSVEITNSYQPGRYFEISARQLDGESVALLSVNKDTLNVATYENNILSKWRLGHSSNYFLVGNDTSGSKLYLATGQNYNDFYQLYADEDYLRFGKQSGGNWTECWRAALKSDLIGRSIYVAHDGGTQNFNIGNNGFLFIPYTSITCGIYYLGTDSAKLILGTEDSDFKVSISGTTCMLQNNKGWNIFCVFIAGQ